MILKQSLEKACCGHIYEMKIFFIAFSQFFKVKHRSDHFGIEGINKFYMLKSYKSDFIVFLTLWKDEYHNLMKGF